MKPENISTLIQAITSIIAVVISTVSLLYVTKSTKDANKPYIVAYTQMVKMSGTIIVYLTIKNFGKTGAYIDKVVATPSLKAGTLIKANNPFNYFKHQMIAPNQAYTSGISTNSTTASLNVQEFELRVDYESLSGKQFTETFFLDINPLADIELMSAHPDNAKSVEKAIYVTSSERISNNLN